ncbi:enoyl-CoA hydratase-related protein [Variovorax sp. NFACC27]|uniref:enoyl-CoA hydratase-related protein n=1 Tax=unclassified Variovorax TaxID=663243 RepID=UPI00089BCB4A|nr:2-(1,2-epoxy-1,2-dihydrophenyl)acetyl-CoA isomerase [Variovorax sp. NFACC28]SEG98570.1 2-(1,2-epoxy-1,2-dihydrophenyl)acetyl-CoA isomerase [Variovorax sp. NFACC29]SFD46556.1 2-(1,2-epoxy-1,2-dihydrophenyl)acetyl-CoA isomerase [Variovorax sp. NFACC26]SFH17950.1 2-(1,2-epoxy-1,2-dihydrophenyl)acetyl-CoA isomerase [Variovorax sp. NFACC27]
MNISEGIAWGVEADVGRIVLKRPERANALGAANGRALVQAIDEVLEQRPRAILLTGEGKVFCAGGAIDEFVAAGESLPELVNEMLNGLHPALLRLSNNPAPLVVAVNGAVGGAGVGLALCGDFVLAAESMKLRTGYAAIGLSPDAGASYFLARRVGPVRAQQLLMLSDAIDSRRCLAWGAVDELHPDAELAGAAEALVTRLAQGASGSFAAIKTLCAGAPGRPFAEHLALEHKLLRERAGSADAREGVAAFMAKRAPRFTGA